MKTLSASNFSILPPASRGNLRRGAALIIVLGLLAVLMLMAVAFAVSMRTERGGSSNLRHATVARAMLDTALARMMQDLDDELGTEPAPPWMLYASTNRADAPANHRAAGVLSYEAAQFLPPDQLMAARKANAGWLPVVASVGLGAADAVVAGRYAYVVLNNTGYLDANLVGGATSRSNGLSATEIRLRDATGGVAAAPTQAKVDKFLADRTGSHGRYNSGSEFFRLATNSLSMNLMKENTFSTNSFAWDSFALESYTPNVSNPAAYGPKSPKIPIAKGSLTFSAAEVAKIKAAFENSFLPARGSKKTGGSAQEFLCPVVSVPTMQKVYLPQSEIATAALYDYVDDDLLSNRDSSGTAYPISGLHWSSRPCAEPVPLFDGFRAVCYEYQEAVGATSTTYSLSVAMNYNTVFLNRTVPDAVKGKTFDISVKVVNIACDGGTAAFKARFNAGVASWIGFENKGTHKFNSDDSVNNTLANPELCTITYFDDTKALPKVVFEVPNTVTFPAQPFDVTFELLATIKLDGKVIQVVPAQENDNEASWGSKTFTRLSLNFTWDRDQFRQMALTPTKAGTLTWAYVLDPRFGYGNSQITPLLWINRQAAAGLGASGAEPLLQAELTRLAALTPPDIHDIGAAYGKPYGRHVNPYRGFVMAASSPATFTSTGVGQWGLDLTDWSDELYHCKLKSPTRDDNPSYVDTVRDAALFMVRNGYPQSVGELGSLILAPLRTVALFDGTHPLDATLVVPRHTVLDWFTVHVPRSTSPVHQTAVLSGRVNLNPPFTLASNGTSTQDPNREPLTSVFTGLPLNEWGSVALGTQKAISWTTAADLVEVLLNDVLWWENTPSAPNAHIQHFYNRGGIAYDLSVLGRTPLDGTTLYRDRRLDMVATALLAPSGKHPNCDFEREALIRNSVEMLTTRQQIFTVVLRADAFTPKFGFSTAGEGTTLSTAQAIAEIWRDPEPMRDVNGNVIWYSVAGDPADATNTRKRPIHPWFVRYLHQF